ncbi:MAG TPA: DUF885 family protein [Planctomycetota bacterium]
MMKGLLATLLVLSCVAAGVGGPGGTPPTARADLRDLVAEYQEDRGALGRFYPLEGSPARVARLTQLSVDWLARLAALDFAALDPESQIDWLALRSRVEGHRLELAREARKLEEEQVLLPFAGRLAALAEARQRVEPLEGRAAAAELDALAKELAELREGFDAAAPEVPKTLAFRAARRMGELREALEDWYSFRAGYDPLFTWWVREPHERIAKALEEHEKYLRETLAGRKEGDEAILGDPIGREALLEDLTQAWIPYTPEELIQIAEAEFAWCEAEMLRAARDMDLGDDWKAALERVKEAHVAPGAQPALILELAREAWDYVEREELVSVPPLAKEVWRVNMLSPEAQRRSPFFLGGESILVAYPTDAMSHEEKLMSMRGNNRHFARATVHHEVIPGHHLQGFMTDRHFAYRWPFGTAFWTEGWALWWEMLLWERGFVATPEDRVGALFWRMHRCARIQFSLGFHLGQMSPQECIDFLVERVGHERENAEAEVRRSFEGGYGPLYQLAYMIGALQFRALYAELVRSGRMSPRAFHDAVLTGGNLPIELVRARLTGQALTPATRTSWRFQELPR